MRYVVVSDIHSNLPALEAVLLDANKIGFDEVICLGDMVGYGPNPNECIDTIFSYPNHTIAGNHDWGTIGKADLIIFNRDARIALNWTQAELTLENLNRLTSLPTSTPLNSHILLSHGSPRKPVWEYLVDIMGAEANFEAFDFTLAFVGHTHLPLVFEYTKAQRVILAVPEVNEPLDLTGKRLIINPGSVGQPRDMNPDASYAIVDTDTQECTFRRIQYDVKETQLRMRNVDLPLHLIARLEIGR